MPSILERQSSKEKKKSLWSHYFIRQICIEYFPWSKKCSRCNEQNKHGPCSHGIYSLAWSRGGEKISGNDKGHKENLNREINVTLNCIYLFMLILLLSSCKQLAFFPLIFSGISFSTSLISNFLCQLMFYSCKHDTIWIIHLLMVALMHSCLFQLLTYFGFILSTLFSIFLTMLLLLFSIIESLLPHLFQVSLQAQFLLKHLQALM